MPGDKSLFDVLTTIWGIRLEKLPPCDKWGYLEDIREVLNTGGCFEDEGFVPFKCNQRGFTIKPLTWFRSREEGAKLIEMLLHL